MDVTGYSPREEWANRLSHGLGLLLGDALEPLEERVLAGHRGVEPVELAVTRHGDDDVLEVVGFGAGDPVEGGMLEQVVLAADGGEVVAPGIAVALRELEHRVVLVDEAVGVDVG